MGAEADIAKGLLSRYATFTHAKVTAKAFPRVKFVPPAEDADSGPVYWLEPKLFPAEGRRVDFASQESDRRGYLQVLVCTRLGNGDTVAREIADAVAAHFPKGYQFKVGARQGKVWQVPTIAGDFDEDGKVKIPVIIRYQAIA